MSARVAKEITGQVLCFLGFVAAALSCGIPMWRVTTFVGPNIVTGQVIWDGLWMNCVMQSTGQMQCTIHQFLLRLSRDLQGARALVVASVVVSALGVGFSFIGVKCMGCLSSPSSRAKVVILSGAVCIAGGVLVLIPVCWSAAFTIQDFTNPGTVEAQKREIGACIFLGWGSALLLIVGGSVLCTSCPPQEPGKYAYYPGRYPYPGPGVPSGTYVPATYSSGKYPPPANYAQPAYGQPKYGQPAYAQPKYGQPANAQPKYPPANYTQPGARSQYAASGYL